MGTNSEARNLWLHNRVQRRRDILRLLDSLCVYGVGYSLSPSKRYVSDSRILMCSDIERSFSHDVVVPAVHTYMQKTWPGSKVAYREFDLDCSPYHGELHITWLPSYITTVRDIEDFWRDYTLRDNLTEVK